MKNNLKILITALFTMSFLPGCYTMLKHPEVNGKDEQGTFTSSVYFYDDCSSCHTGNTVIAGNFIKRQDLKPVNTYDRDASGNETDNTGSYYDYYGSTPYYIDSYYGGYGYYYHRPWWYDAAPIIKERVTEIKKLESAVSKGRNNDGGRNDGGGRNDRAGRTGTTYTPTPTSTGTSTSTSTSTSGSSSEERTSSSSTTTSSSSGSGSTDRGNSTSSTSSSGNDSRSSSGSSGARNNDGQRSTSSGRR